jgi:RNA polymerase primary sigma factor
MTDTQEPAETSSDGPLLDLTDAGVKKFIKQAKARGYVTMEELNKVLPSEEVTPDAIEDTLAMLSEMGVNVVEAEEDAAESSGGEVAERAETQISDENAKPTYDRTDDPVRMYLREMGSVELLSREGEIAIAKRIEAGRDAMISGLCESALTFEAIMVWRDELANNRILLREVIDLDATYGVINPSSLPHNQPQAGIPGQPQPAAAEPEEGAAEKPEGEMTRRTRTSTTAAGCPSRRWKPSCATASWRRWTPSLRTSTPSANCRKSWSRAVSRART